MARLSVAQKERAKIRCLWKAGGISFTKTIPLVGTTHACGTLATGNDPYTSVVDTSKVHGMDNLYYAVNGSILLSSSRVSPALSIAN